MIKPVIILLLMVSVSYGQGDPAAAYKLQPTSPAIGHGIVEDGPKHDLYGNPRVDAQGNPRNDVGAIQYVAETPPPPTTCEEQLAAANSQIASLTTQVNSLTNEIQSLQVSVASLQADIIYYQSQITNLQNKVASLQSDITAANTRVTKLTKAINDALLVLKNPGKNKQQTINQAVGILQQGLI